MSNETKFLERFPTDDVPAWEPTVNVERPGVDLTADGWELGESPESKHHNWLFKQLSRWATKTANFSRHVHPDIVAGSAIGGRVTHTQATIEAGAANGDKILLLDGLTFTTDRTIDKDVVFLMDTPAAAIDIDLFDLTLSGNVSGEIRAIGTGTIEISGTAIGLIINSATAKVEFSGTGFILYNGQLLVNKDPNFYNRTALNLKNFVEQQPGNFVYLDGLTDNISLDNDININFGVDDFSIELQFRTSADYSAGAGYLLNKGDGTEHISVYINTDNKLVFELRDSGAAVDIVSDYVVNDGALHDLVLTCDRDGLFKMFSNGLTQADTETSPTGALDNTEKLYLGRDNAGANLFKGEIHSCRIWNRLLTDTEAKEISASINRALSFDDYAGDNTDLNTDYNAISAVIGRESDAITGWTSDAIGGSSVFQSQSGTKVSGTYAFEINLNATPAADARIYKDIETDFGLVVGKRYRLKFKWRHIGTGDGWSAEFGSANTGGESLGTVISTETSFAGVIVEFIHSPGSKYLVFRENNALGNGGIYLDDLSLNQIGCSLELSPKTVGLDNGKWLDNTGNSNDGTQNAKPAFYPLTKTNLQINTSIEFTEALTNTPAEISKFRDQAAPIGSFIGIYPGVDEAKAIDSEYWQYCNGNEIDEYFKFTYPDGSQSADILIPNLTDDRFLMGATAYGKGGSNFLTDHTHDCGNESQGHSHTTGIGTPTSGTESADHSHALSIGVNNGGSWGGVNAAWAGAVVGVQGSTYGRSPGHTHSTSIGSPTSGGISASHNHSIGSGLAPTSTSLLPQYFKVKYFLRIK